MLDQHRQSVSQYTTPGNQICAAKVWWNASYTSMNIAGDSGHPSLTPRSNEYQIEPYRNLLLSYISLTMSTKCCGAPMAGT